MFWGVLHCMGVNDFLQIIQEKSVPTARQATPWLGKALWFHTFTVQKDVLLSPPLSSS